MINGLHLQKETVLQVKQDLIDLMHDNIYLEKRQINSLFFIKNNEKKFKVEITAYYNNNAGGALYDKGGFHDACMTFYQWNFEDP